MDLDRMLMLCQRDQWKLGDLDFSGRPRAMTRAEEEHVVQLFMDMAGIEELAAALFREQERRAHARGDERLRIIFQSFVVDELRHAEVARRLARYYDVHHYRRYQRNASLTRFTPHFLAVIRELNDDVANTYVTTGELILDVALLRTLNEYVRDPMSQRAMDLINRDESRHIAVDYHMMEYYASSEYHRLSRQRPRGTAREELRAFGHFVGMLWHAAPFFRGVFFRPMDYMDPSGRRLLAAFRRSQLLSERPGIRELPFVVFLRTLQDGFNRPLVRATLGPLLCRAAGLEPRFLQNLVTDEERRAANRKSFDELAAEALAEKYKN